MSRGGLNITPACMHAHTHIQQYPSNALERQQLSCGVFNEQDIEEAFTFLEEHGLPMFDAREVCMYTCM